MPNVSYDSPVLFPQQRVRLPNVRRLVVRRGFLLKFFSFIPWFFFLHLRTTCGNIDQWPPIHLLKPIFCRNKVEKEKNDSNLQNVTLTKASQCSDRNRSDVLYISEFQLFRSMHFHYFHVQSLFVPKLYIL